MRWASMPAPLATTIGACHRVGIVFDGHGQFGRVRDHDIGLRHGRLHAIQDQLALDLAPASGHLRIALQGLHFFADFLRGHLQVLLKFPFLECVVEDGEYQQRDADLEAGSQQDFEENAGDFADLACAHRQDDALTWSSRHQTATATTTLILNSPKPRRTKLLIDTRRCTPLSGLTRLKSGASLLGQKQGPDLQQVHEDGHEQQRAEDRAAMPDQSQQDAIPLVSDELSVGGQPGFSPQLLFVPAGPDSWSRVPPKYISTSVAPTSSAAEARSWLRATCPSSRAF